MHSCNSISTLSAAACWLGRHCGDMESTQRHINRQERLIVHAKFRQTISIQRQIPNGDVSHDWNRTCYYANEETLWSTKEFID